MRFRHFLLAITYLLAAACAADAQSCFPLSAGTYTQNFDSLAAAGTANTWTDNSTIPYWYSNRTVYRASAGTDNAGALYSFGSSTDRALGSIGSGSVPLIVYGVCFVNDTAQAVPSLSIAYNGEQWRNGNNAAAHTLSFEYQLNAAGINAGTWTGLSALDFTSPVTGLAVETGIGNTTGKVPLSATLPVNVAPGQTIWIRWRDIDNSGNDHALGVDDLSVTTGSGTSTPVLSINDVAANEGASGITTFTFTVSLNTDAPAGGVTFDIATADGTATAGSDYTAKSLTGQFIPAGSRTYTFTVDVYGDLAPEQNETFFANVSNVTGATVGDSQGVGTILNYVPCNAIPIHSVQGSGAQSPLSGSVTVEGIVTAKNGSGFYVQEEDADADGNPATSEGLYIYTQSAPSVAVRDKVCVTGTISEYPAGTLRSLTELGSPSVAVEANNQPLPSAVSLSLAELSPGATWDNLERYEGMRVTLPVMRAVSGSSTAATFYAVPDSVATPYREPGIEAPFGIPLLSLKTMPPVPRFDSNPEVIEIHTNISGLAVTPGMTISNFQGVVDVYDGRYSILQEAGTSPTLAGTVAAATPVVAPTTGQITIASFNTLNFSSNATKQAKAVRAIRDVLRYPDVIAMQEVDNIASLNALATTLNAQPGLNYRAYLGTTASSQNVGVLVKTSRVSVVSAYEILTSDQFVNPSNNTLTTVHDRAPFLLKASAQAAGGTQFPFTVMVLHPRSLIGIEDDTTNGLSTQGDFVRSKRLGQAESIRQYLQSNLAPGERLFVAGDFNAFQFSDGYVDFTGIIRGTPVPANQVVLASGDFTYNYTLAELAETRLAAADRWSYTFHGSLQVLDHILASPAADAAVAAFQYAHLNATFPEAWSSDSSRPEGVSDHDIPLAYVNLPNAAPVASNATVVVPFNTAASFALNATDDSGSVVLSTATDPVRGAVAYNGLQATYTPNTGATGGDSFVFRATDAGGLSATGAVKVLYDMAAVLNVTFGGVVVHPVTKEYRLTVRVTNTGSEPVTGPVHVVFESLLSGVTMTNANGTTAAGKPYITVPGSPINPGSTVSVIATFNNPSKAVLSPLPTSILNGNF